MTPAIELRRGWPVLAAAFCGITTGVLAFPFNLIGPQMKPMQLELGWSGTALAATSSCIGVGLVIGSPIAGRLIDRFGGRRVALVSMTLLALILAMLSRIGSDILHLYSAYFSMGLLCAGSGIATYTRALGGWFHASRGLALGIALSGTGIAVFIAPLMAHAVQQAFGWRAVYLATAAIVVAAMPIIAFGLRDNPANQPEAKVHAHSISAVRLWRTLAQDPRFILLAITLALMGLVFGGTILHFVPMLLDQGYASDAAAGIASVLGIALIAGRVGMGWLIDRYSAPHLAALCFLLAAVGGVAFVVGGPSLAILPIVLIGFLWGAEYDLVAYMTMRYFGLRNYGSIYSALFSVYVFVGLSSPFLAGTLIERGGYALLFITDAVVFVVTAAIFLFLAYVSAGRRYSGVQPPDMGFEQPRAGA